MAYNIIVALDNLTDTEIIDLQKRGREGAINRIRALERVQAQLTGVMTQLTQIVSSIDEADRNDASSVANIPSSSKQ